MTRPGDPDVDPADNAPAVPVPAQVGAQPAPDVDAEIADPEPAEPADTEIADTEPAETAATAAVPARKAGFSVGTLLAAAVLVALVGGVAGGLIVHWTASTTAPTECDAVSLADAVLPSVVTINVSNGSSRSNGSGEVLHAEGYILTNDHVISPGADSGTLTVLFSSGETLPATVVGRAPEVDLAVIKVEPTKSLPVIAISPDSVPVGQPVVALGSPLGLSGSVTRGIVSALGRDVRVPADAGATALITGAIQTDASINPGNSGGPLVDCQGRMVGVNTAIATVPNDEGATGGGSVGIGFAIPVEAAVDVAEELIATGQFSVPTFGMSVSPITPAIAAQFGLQPGLFVKEVYPGGPAEAAGIAVGDVIVSVAGTPARSQDTLTHTALVRSPGDAVEITFVRDGTTQQTSVTLG